MFDALSTVHRRLAAASLGGFVALLYAQDAIDPTDVADNSARVAAADAHPARLALAGALLILSSAFMIGAIAAIVALVRDRGRVLAWVGALLALLGALGHAAVAGFYATLAGLAGGERTEMAAVLDRIDDSVAAGIVVVPAIAGFALGVFVLGLALARSRLLPVWAALFPIASFALELAPLDPLPALDLAQTVGVVPFLWLALRLVAPREPLPRVANA